MINYVLFKVRSIHRYFLLNLKFTTATTTESFLNIYCSVIVIKIYLRES